MEHSLINVAVLRLSEENVQDIPTIKSLSMKKLLACNLHLTDSSYDLKSSFVSCDDWVSRLSAAGTSGVREPSECQLLLPPVSGDAKEENQILPIGFSPSIPPNSHHSSFQSIIHMFIQCVF